MLIDDFGRHLERIIDKMFRQVFRPRNVEFRFAALAIEPPHRVAEPRKIVQDARAQMFHFEQIGAGHAAPHEIDRARRQGPAGTAENLVVRIGARRPGRRNTFGAESGDEITRRLDCRPATPGDTAAGFPLHREKKKCRRDFGQEPES